MMYLQRPFRLLAADLSLRRPAFAVLEVDPKEQQIRILKLVDIDNQRKQSAHGSMMLHILEMIEQLCPDVDLFVREYASISRTSERTLFEVHGVAELALWQARQTRFFDLYPTQVKKLVAGKGTADKAKVASALGRFVGPRAYDCDGQSDAVAVGIAWLKGAGILTETRQGWYINNLLERPQTDKWHINELYSAIEEVIAFA